MQSTLFAQPPIGGLSNEISNSYNATLFRRQNLIEPSFEIGSISLKPEIKKVAAYCRVSTLSDMQENSLENQSMYYTNYIRKNPNWYFAGIYSDRGKSGTKIDCRSGFQKLIRNAMEGKIDLILCKSISRFARNVIDTLDVLRKLKEYGIRVIFDKENIDTNTMQTEFVITLLAAVAQEESRSISDNVIWSNAKRFERGEAIFTRMLGYTKFNEKTWTVVKEEAETVKEAFELYKSGINSIQIARIFISKGYKKENGRKDWSGTAVRDILKNEKYVGDVLCQKTYTKNHLSHEVEKNKGNKNQYYIKSHHEDIIDRATFDKVQDILSAMPTLVGHGRNKSYPLTGRLICGECGGNLHRFDCRGVLTWRCGNRVKSNSLCSFGGVTEENMKSAMMKAFVKYYKLTNTLKKPFGKQTIKDMMKDLKTVQYICDIEYNKLRMELQRVLFEENMIILKAEESSGRENNKSEILKIKRAEIEAQLKRKENWGNMLDKDNIYRVSVLEKLELLSRMNRPLSGLKKHLENDNCIEFFRAWAVLIKVVSPTSFFITWVNGDETNVELSKGDNEAWMKITEIQGMKHPQSLHI